MNFFFTVNTERTVTGFWEWEDAAKKIGFIINGNWYGKFDDLKLIGIYRGHQPGLHNKVLKEVGENLGMSYQIIPCPDSLEINYWDYNATIVNMQDYINQQTSSNTA